MEFPLVDEQLRIIRRGAADIIVEAELAQKLERSRRAHTPLNVKLGLDPTAPDLHLGHTVVLRKLRDFQDLGHQAIVIIGDFTGMIGDPTGRSETRKPLTRDEIRANADTYRAQLGKVIDMSHARVEFNSTWLAPLTFEGVIRETANLTVARMLQRPFVRDGVIRALPLFFGHWTRTRDLPPVASRTFAERWADLESEDHS